MAVLTRIAALVALLSGCYSPRLRDCVVTCTTGDDCGPNQICGADGRCAAPDVAGSCSTTAELPDAGVQVAPDARMIDAPLDSQPLASLVVQIAGKGTVTVTGIGSCNSNAASHACTFPVTANTTVELVATGLSGDDFDRWQSAACAGQDETCTTTVASPSTTVAAKFSH